MEPSGQFVLRNTLSGLMSLIPVNLPVMSKTRGAFYGRKMHNGAVGAAFNRLLLPLTPLPFGIPTEMLLRLDHEDGALEMGLCKETLLQVRKQQEEAVHKAGRGSLRKPSTCQHLPSPELWEINVHTFPLQYLFKQPELIKSGAEKTDLKFSFS